MEPATKKEAKGTDPNENPDTLGQMSGAPGWGEVKEQQPSKEEILSMQKRGKIAQMEQILKQKQLHPLQRKMINNQITLLKSHGFWDNQPVRQFGMAPPKNDGPLERKKVDDVSKEGSKLPAGFEWCSLDLKDDDQANQLYTLLREHYVEDSEGKFRFDYPVGLIRWVLCVPGFNPDWHVGIRSTKDKKLLAFISGTPVKVSVRKATVKMAEINFLCVHRRLRDKRLAPVLIQEVTRRVNLTNVWQAIYTSGQVFPWPLSHANYFHRNLNPKKNVETGFSHKPEDLPMSRYIKKYKLDQEENLAISGTPRLMQKKDYPQVYALYKEHMSKFELTFKFSQDELAHQLMPQQGVVYTIVIEDNETKKLTDFVSFYNLPSQILKQDTHSHTHMNVAYLYYWATTTNKITELVKYALLYAKEKVPEEEAFDVFNCLDLMGNNEFIQECKFGQGDGLLQFYLYNYLIGNENGVLLPDQIGTVLI